jgi:hypothetical protein
VQRWNQHGENFGKQDAKMQEAIQTAIEKFQKAKEEMEASKEALNQCDQASSEVLEISDEELMMSHHRFLRTFRAWSIPSKRSEPGRRRASTKVPPRSHG